MTETTFEFNLFEGNKETVNSILEKYIKGTDLDDGKTINLDKDGYYSVECMPMGWDKLSTLIQTISLNVVAYNEEAVFLISGYQVISTSDGESYTEVYCDHGVADIKTLSYAGWYHGECTECGDIGLVAMRDFKENMTYKCSACNKEYTSDEIAKLFGFDIYDFKYGFDLRKQITKVSVDPSLIASAILSIFLIFENLMAGKIKDDETNNAEYVKYVGLSDVDSKQLIQYFISLWMQDDAKFFTLVRNIADKVSESPEDVIKILTNIHNKIATRYPFYDEQIVKMSELLRLGYNPYSTKKKYSEVAAKYKSDISTVKEVLGMDIKKSGTSKGTTKSQPGDAKPTPKKEKALIESSIEEFRISGDVLEKYDGNAQKVTIPDQVRIVGKEAFAKNKKIRELIMPDTVVEIAESGFRSCSSLQKIKMSESLCTVGAKAFAGCSQLKEAILPDSIIHIGKNAFDTCAALEYVKWPKNVKTIPEKCFMACRELTRMDLPDGMLAIEGDNSAVLKTQKGRIPDSIIFLGAGACCACNSTESITLPEGIEAIPHYCFGRTDIKSVVIPPYVEKIGDSAFDHCLGLTEIVIPEGVKEIGNWSFGTMWRSAKDDTDIAVHVPYSVKKIGFEAFNTAKSVHVYEDSVAAEICRTYEDQTNIVYEPALSESEKAKALAAADRADAFRKSRAEERNRLLKEAGVDLKQKALTSEFTQKYIPKSYRASAKESKQGDIGDSGMAITKTGVLKAYSGHDEEVHIPEGVVTIGKGAFSKDAHIRHIFAPNSLKRIEDFAFEECKCLETIMLPDTLEYIGDYAFRKCIKLKDFIVPGNVTAILYNTFESCDSLMRIAVHDKVNYIEQASYSIFSDALEKKGRTVYGAANSYAQKRCPGYFSTDIPDDLPLSSCTLTDEELERRRYVIHGKNDLVAVITDDKTVIIPEEFEHFYGNHTFAETQVERVIFHNSAKIIGGLKYAASLKSFEVPYGVTRIPHGAFYGCKQLEYVTLPETVTTIEYSAFEGCRNLRSINIPKDAKIATDAFSIKKNWWEDDLYPNLTIYGTPGSVAEKRAIQAGIKFQTGLPAGVPAPRVENDPRFSKEKLDQMAEQIKKSRKAPASQNVKRSEPPKPEKATSVPEPEKENVKEKKEGFFTRLFGKKK